MCETISLTHIVTPISRLPHRGGLAERAERLFSQSSTNFSLWQTGFTRQLEGAKHTKEDLRLRVESIISYTKSTTRPSMSSADALPRTAITKCREVLPDMLEKPDSSPQEKTVVFLFANHKTVSSAVGFEEGKEVCVWRPWQEIELPAVHDQSHLPTMEVRTPPTASNGAALLCSRFLVLV